MHSRISNKKVAAPVRASTSAPAKASGTARASRAELSRDELSVGRGRALRAHAAGVAAPPAPGADYQTAFDLALARVNRAVAAGRPGAAEEREAILRDQKGIQQGVADLERKIAANEDPATWANVPPEVARAEQAEQRAQLANQLKEMKKFGVKVAKMTPKQRQDLQNFFRLAKEDPAAFKRFVDGVKAREAAGAGAATGAGPVTPPATGAPANIQAAIDFGLSQLGAPYVGGASPFRFGTPGDGRTYQMQGQKPYVSPRGVVGYDCSGLMVTMLKKAGIDISRYGSSRAMKSGLPEVPKDQLRPGDLLVKNGHVAMYIGNGQMIESVPSGVKVSDASKYINDPAYSGHRPG